MPWDVTIRNADETPLGERDEVLRRMAAAVPALEWGQEPSLLEQMKDMPGHPFHALILTWPEELRANASRPKTVAEYSGGAFFVRLYGFDRQPITAVLAEVRGDGNPLPFFAALCIPNGWVAVDDAEGQSLDFSKEEAAGWEAFREHRDRAIREIEVTEKPGESG